MVILKALGSATLIFDSRRGRDWDCLGGSTGGGSASMAVVSVCDTFGFCAGGVVGCVSEESGSSVWVAMLT